MCLEIEVGTPGFVPRGSGWYEPLVKALLAGGLRGESYLWSCCAHLKAGSTPLDPTPILYTFVLLFRTPSIGDLHLRQQ